MFYVVLSASYALHTLQLYMTTSPHNPFHICATQVILNMLH